MAADRRNKVDDNQLAVDASTSPPLSLVLTASVACLIEFLLDLYNYAELVLFLLL